MSATARCLVKNGVIIDEHLKWKQHVSYISSKIKRGIGILSKMRHFVTTKILVNLYYTMIYPYLTYSVLAWGSTYDSTLRSITILQKRAIRIMFFQTTGIIQIPCSLG